MKHWNVSLSLSLSLSFIHNPNFKIFEVYFSSLCYVSPGRARESYNFNLPETLLLEFNNLCNVWRNGVERGIHTFYHRVCNSREYTYGLSARFNSWLWSQNKRKVDVELQATREETINWYSELSVHSRSDSNCCVNFLTYILLYIPCPSPCVHSIYTVILNL